MPRLTRYAVIKEKNPREIVLLRGLGCAWKKCRFCDYHLDSSADGAANLSLNREALAHVTGLFGRLEAINSGSFFELDEASREETARICTEKQISILHIESHWMYRDRLAALREDYGARGVTVKAKIGIETFDPVYREKYMHKGLTENDPAEIARYFDECCLLFGLPGQTELTMLRDVELALKYFERVCVNLMCKNTSALRPDAASTAVFEEYISPLYADNPRVDLLSSNFDFGVGIPIDE